MDKTNETLLSYGIDRRSKGFLYLSDGMGMLLSGAVDTEPLLLKDLYKKVASLRSTSSPNVEQAIRTAIKKSENGESYTNKSFILEIYDVLNKESSYGR